MNSLIQGTTDRIMARAQSTMDLRGAMSYMRLELAQDAFDHSIKTKINSTSNSTAVASGGQSVTTGAPNSGLIQQPDSFTSSLTGRNVQYGMPIGAHGHPGDPVFADQVGDASLLAASFLVPGGAAAALARTAAGRLLLHGASLGMFAANPENPINAVPFLPNGMGIGIVQNGRVIQHDLTVSTSHAALAARAGVLRPDGTLANGAQAIIWTVQNNVITTRASINFPSQTTQATDDAVRRFLEGVLKANSGKGGG